MANNGLDSNHRSFRSGWTQCAFGVLGGGLILFASETSGWSQERGRTVSLVGALTPLASVSIGSQISGIVTEVLCDFNMPVKKGQVCARIDPRPFQQRVEQGRANLTRAKAELAKQQANLVYVTSVYERNLALSQRGVISKAAFEGSESSFAQAKAQVDIDKAIIEQRQAELGEAELQLSYTTIASPIDGIVTTRKVAVGETVTATYQTPELFTIAQEFSKLHLMAKLKETEISSLKEGDEVSFTLKAFNNRPFRGKVKQIRLSGDSSQGEALYTAIIEVDNSDLSLKPGMTATIRVVSSEK